MASSPSHRDLHGRATRNPPISGRQWSIEPNPDDSSFAPRRLFLRSVQLTRKRDRTKQGRLLSRPTPDPGDGEDRCTRLAALGAVFPSRLATANETLG